jgi:hypothetical protein
MSNITSWRETVGVDASIEKINTYEYEPHQGTRLNDVGDIRITINNEDQFIHPARSHLYIEGELTPRSGRKYTPDECGISLVNNGLMYLFNRIDYAIANTKIEGFNNPGRATTMKGLLSYPIVYPEGMSFLWSLDENAGIAENDGFKKRCQYIHLGGNGRFSAMIPLSHIFGFCEQYDKVMYGAKHEITLHRSDDEDAIFRSSEKEGDEDKVKKGKITLTKISWRMPILKLSDESKISLFGDVQKKVIIPIEFLSRQCESIQLNAGQRQLDWRLSVSTGSERPRYVVLAFQRNKMDRDTGNSAIFDNLDLENARVEFNGEYYPENDLMLDFENNRYVIGYQMLTDFYHNVMGREGCSVRLRDFKSHYPLLVFDISRQSERMKDTASDIRIKATFAKNIPLNSYAYALVLSDREIQMQSDGDRMRVIH